MTPQTITVLFADLAGSTQLYQTEGDVEAHQLVTDSLHCMREAVEKGQGTLLRTVGDAVLASFIQADSAYLAAIEIQRAHQALNLSVRVGFHHGEVIPDGGDIYGNAVNLAARVAGFTEADEICTTEDTIRQLSIKHRSNSVYLDRVNFNGINEPISVYRVQWENDGAQTAIVTALSHTERYQTNQVLDLLIGAKRIRIDGNNPAISFGRAFDNDVTIDKESVSRNHAKIEMANGRFMFKDHSTNGTYLIRGGFKPEFIRRESTPLDNFGSIGLGFSPTVNADDVIEFRTTTVAP